MECWKGIQVVFTIVSFERADCDGVRVCTMCFLPLLLVCVQRDSFKVVCTIHENSSTMIIIFVKYFHLSVSLETRGSFREVVVEVLLFPRDKDQLLIAIKVFRPYLKLLE